MQESLFGGWATTDLIVTLHLEPNGKTGGRVQAEVVNELGQRSERFTVVWKKERDVNDLPLFAKAIVEAWLWAPAGGVSDVVRTGVRAWLPEVPSGK